VHRKARVGSLTAITCLIALGFPYGGYAGTVGNPANTDLPTTMGAFNIRGEKKVSIKAGLDYEFLMNRDLKADGPSTGKINIDKADWIMGRLSCLFFDHIEPYIKVGTAHVKTRWIDDNIELKLESNYDAAYAVGGKVLIWDFLRPKLKLVGDGFWRTAKLNPDEGSHGIVKLDLDNNKSRIDYQEWQTALLLSSEFDVGNADREEVLGVSLLVPYVGVKYSDVRMRLRSVVSDALYYNPGRVKAKDNFGFFAGCDFTGPNAISVSVEGRFLDETAITAGFTVVF